MGLGGRFKTVYNDNKSASPWRKSDFKQDPSNSQPTPTPTQKKEERRTYTRLPEHCKYTPELVYA